MKSPFKPVLWASGKLTWFWPHQSPSWCMVDRMKVKIFLKIMSDVKAVEVFVPRARGCCEGVCFSSSVFSEGVGQKGCGIVTSQTQTAAFANQELKYMKERA